MDIFRKLCKTSCAQMASRHKKSRSSWEQKTIHLRKYDKKNPFKLFVKVVPIINIASKWKCNIFSSVTNFPLSAKTSSIINCVIFKIP